MRLILPGRGRRQPALPQVNSPASSGMATNPSHHGLRVSVRRKNRIDAVRNTSLPDDKGDALEQTHTLHLEPRQPETRREFACGVTQQLERQVQSAHGFALVVRGLSAQAVNDRAELLQLPMMVAVGARLWRAAASARYRVPTGCASQGHSIRATGARVAIHHDQRNCLIVKPD